MINEYIKKLSKLMNSSVVTPYNLLENIILDNYVSINYFKKENDILSDVIFVVNNKEITYRYIFNLNNDLKQIYEINDDDGNILIFDKCKEEERLIDDINQLNLNHKKENCM